LAAERLGFRGGAIVDDEISYPVRGRFAASALPYANPTNPFFVLITITLTTRDGWGN